MERSKTSGRADDTESTAYTALARFEKHSAPVVKEFAAKDMLTTVDCGAGQSEEGVYGQLRPHVMSMVSDAIRAGV
jgi:adenylate kinase family enzyme